METHRHKSTERKELYAHYQEGNARWRGGTVFARLEEDGWYATASLCLIGDHFCKKIGRNVARRKYMNTNNGGIGSPLHRRGTKLQINSDEMPSYDALRLVYISYCVAACDRK